ncbi:receptor-like protein 9DC3 [Cryptomeria japonica]|uniref:receptor-like protein 9DC3 n=1 Tax=Cryptomeria japonica TaxID=3369 RepID=UPI0027DA6750|nr:receptor-like protein 9DC3 [Cryptomeria japonica]
MVLLESLDLSHNRLSRIIPIELVKLTFLSELNLSYNYLTGEIPQGGQFFTFEASSFSNNSDVCGLPLNEPCCDFDELTKPCLPSPPTTPKVNKTDEEENVDTSDIEENMWWRVAVGLSFAFAFNLVIGVLCLPTTLGSRTLGSELQVASDEWGKAISTMHGLRRLQMSNCMLSGLIPPSLANLTSLHHLQLDGNSFFSSIPARLHNLSNLVSLKLSSCELNGSIPSDLLTLPNLQEVDLSANLDLRGKLSSILPPHSARLNNIVLTTTRVGGAIPDSFANISSLTLLDLSDFFVQGQLPPTIANLTGLVMLDISNNMLRGSIPFFGAKHPLGTFPLAYIDLSYNQLEGNILSMLFGAFGKLRYVHLRQNLLTGAIPSPDMNLTSLTWLDLSYNKLNGTISSLANSKSLVLLDLSNNLLSGKIPASVNQLLFLETLDLRNNLLTDAIPNNISNLS